MKRSAIALGFAALFATAAAAPARTISLDDFPAVGVSDAQIAPNASAIAYIVAKPDMKNDRYDRSLMLYDVASHRERALTFDRQGLGSPAWSPQGDKIAFLAQRGSGSEAREQIFVLDMSGGDARAITSAKNGVEQFAWRPDGNAIAYVTPDDPKNERDAKGHLDAFVVGDQAYTDREAPSPRHIWIVGADGSGSKRLTAGSWSLPSSEPPSSPASPISWSPDGRSITFTKMPNAYDADSDAAVAAIVDVATGTVRQLTAHGRLEGFSEFSPDGAHLAYWYPYKGDPAGQNDIFVAPSNGGDGTDVTAGEIDTNVQRAMWMPDSKSLLISGHKGTDAALWIKPLDGRARRIELGGVQPTQPYWLDASIAAGGAIAFTGSEAQHPAELYMLPPGGGKPERLTHYNDSIAALRLGRVESIEWTGSNGFAEDGVLTYPPDYDAAKEYPLVLNIHGGPNSASLTSFNIFSQILAARGSIVFSPNYRGSDNLGEAYWHAIVDDSGAGPARDVIAGIGAVRKHVKIDAGRIGVSGWSYGGYMTTWLIGHYHVWKAAVAGAPVTNLIDEYSLADNGVGWRYSIGGSPFTGKFGEHYREQSPLTYAWDVTTPTLLLHDTRDARVPITQSYEFFRALRDRGTPVKFYAYPVAGHFPADPVRARDVYRKWADWFDRYFK